MNIPSFDAIFDQIKINFWLIGIPLHDTKINFRFYGLWICLVFMVVEEVLFFISEFSYEKFLELTQLAPCICVGTLSVAKILFIAEKRREIAKLANTLKTLYEIAINDVNKRNLISKDFVFLKHLIKHFFVLNGVLISVYNFSTLIFILYHYVTKRKIILTLPYAIFAPFDTEIWYYWLVIYTFSIFCGFVCVLYFTTVDALYFITTTHICSQFSLLSEEIQRLDVKSAYTLNNIIQKHQYILKLSQDLEEIFKGPNLLNVLIGSVEICALGFNLTMGKWTEIPGVVLFLLSVLLQILMMSVYGENLIRESKIIGDAAFLCEWYTMDQASKKLILLLMLRANKPQVLTAYKFSKMSYESFTKIISKSWSYFTILKTVYTPGEMTVQE